MNTELAKQLFHYENGKLFWKVRANSQTNIGKEAGAVVSGYRRFDYNKRKYRTHNIVWIWHGNTIPPNYIIDHINNISTDNRIENLRLATHSQNMMNACISKRNTSGEKHISFNTKRQHWKVNIRKDNKYYVSKGYKTKEECIPIRDAMLEELHGEFKRLK